MSYHLNTICGKPQYCYFTGELFEIVTNFLSSVAKKSILLPKLRFSYIMCRPLFFLKQSGFYTNESKIFGKILNVLFFCVSVEANVVGYNTMCFYFTKQMFNKFWLKILINIKININIPK